MPDNDSESDGIEIVEKASSSRARNDDICQLCSTTLHGLTAAQRTDHYKDKHASDVASQRAVKRSKQTPASVASPKRKTTPMKIQRRRGNTAPEDVFWYPARAVAPPDNYSPGVLSILKEALKQSYKKGAIQRAVLCYEWTPHIYRESFDAGWGCGYRNFMMACAALMDQQVQTLYFPSLDDPMPPGVRNLQHWLEAAWKQGYDDDGADHFERTLVDTKKKLGTDLYVAFTSRKIPCMLVDFNIKDATKGFDTLTDWVVSYFTEKLEGNVNTILRVSSPVTVTNKMPIILQYDGHSVTIVGYERVKNDKYNLLVFDPSSKVDKSIRQAALNASTSVEWKSPVSGKSRRRDRSKSPAPKKRARTSQDPDDDGVVSIPDSDDEIAHARRAVALNSTLDPEMVVKTFRMKNIKKKDQYQLLYFTMGDLLSDEEQNNRKVVLSVAEC